MVACSLEKLKEHMYNKEGWQEHSGQDKEWKLLLDLPLRTCLIRPAYLLGNTELEMA